LSTTKAINGRPNKWSNKKKESANAIVMAASPATIKE
jgi:hypothetical protein